MTVIEKLPNAVRRTLVILAHLVLWVVSYAGAYLLRFEGRVPADEFPSAYYGLAALLALHTGAFWVSGLFHAIMRYAGIPEVRSIVRATTISTLLLVVLAMILPEFRIPRSIYVGQWLLAVTAAGSLRLGIRILRERKRPVQTSKLKRALLLGAGDAGEMFLRDLGRLPKPEMTVVGILDDDAGKHDTWLRGVRVLGAIDEGSLRSAIEQQGATLAVLAMPSAAGPRIRKLVSLCRALGLETKTLPGLQQILRGEVRVSMLRDVAIEDLLRREPVELDQASMDRFLRGKRVLVTGGAGSIGSELARQALQNDPSCLALLDHNENALFFLERELKAAFPKAKILPLIGDVKDSRRIGHVMSQLRPHVVLHAAAHKHVPMMEANPSEAIKNNVFGTRVVADLAQAHGVDTFVLISTDKAVNPTSVMGATKRLAETYVQALSQVGRTRFVAVRFGNVLGSAGSVVQIFRQQIAAGGPVTVTHPDMTRYFMTIPEACQLVLQAGALGGGGEIFLLDMGEPVRIVDLAHDMIRMTGYEPGVDIEVNFSGVRPGEKLYEELLYDTETHSRTVHPKILGARIPPMELASARGMLDTLVTSLDSGADSLRHELAVRVPEARLFREESDPVSQEVQGAMHSLEALDSLAFRPVS